MDCSCSQSHLLLHSMRPEVGAFNRPGQHLSPVPTVTATHPVTLVGLEPSSASPKFHISSKLQGPEVKSPESCEVQPQDRVLVHTDVGFGVPEVEPRASLTCATQGLFHRATSPAPHNMHFHSTCSTQGSRELSVRQASLHGAPQMRWLTKAILRHSQKPTWPISP